MFQATCETQKQHLMSTCSAVGVWCMDCRQHREQACCLLLYPLPCRHAASSLVLMPPLMALAMGVALTGANCRCFWTKDEHQQQAESFVEPATGRIVLAA